MLRRYIGTPEMRDSSNWQHIADIPEEDFIQHIERTKDKEMSYIRYKDIDAVSFFALTSERAC